MVSFIANWHIFLNPVKVSAYSIWLYSAILLIIWVDTTVDINILLSPDEFSIIYSDNSIPVSQPVKYFHVPSNYFSATARRSWSGSPAKISYVSSSAWPANLYIFYTNSGFGFSIPPKYGSGTIESLNTFILVVSKPKFYAILIKALYPTPNIAEY